MNRFHLYAAFTKSSIDVAKRTVTGIAQVESPTADSQGDIVDFEASKRAFAAWVGNIREMHGPKAVGKCVSWWADPKTKRIYVRARISEGAEDTWQKVLDGTLSGFSIGGQQISARRGIDKTTGLPANRITAYRLNELSLVDSPANADCVITAIHKRNGHLETTDVIGAQRMGLDKTKFAALKKSIATFNAGVGANEEVFVIKKGDINFAHGGGLVVVKNEAIPLTLKKADMDMMADDDAQSGGGGVQSDPDLQNIDLEDHATNMANAHKDLCKMAGIDDHVGHYEDATSGDEQADPDEGGGNLDTGAEGADLQMARRTGNLRKQNRKLRKAAAATEAEIEKRIAKAVGDATSALAAKVDELTKATTGGGTPAPRKTDASGEEGSPMQKTVADIAGANGERLEKGSAGRYVALKKRKDELDAKVTEILAKMKSGHPLTSAEDVERQRVGRELSLVEVELSELVGRAQGVGV